MSYYEKYLKYKSKYLNLKKLLGGNDEVNKYLKVESSEFLSTKYLKINSTLIEELKKKLENSSTFYTSAQIKTYLNAIDGFYMVYHGCKLLDSISRIEQHTCNAKMKLVHDLYPKIVQRLKDIPSIGSEAAAKRLVVTHAPNFSNWKN